MATALTLLLCIWLLVPAAAAQAEPASRSWEKAAGLVGTDHFVGQHRNNAGLIAYCTDFKKLAPSYADSYDDGHGGGFVQSNGHALSKTENAALSYLLNRWGAASSNETAASVQLAVWAMTSPGMAWGSPAMKALIEAENLPRAVIAEAKSMTRTSTSNAGPYTVRIDLGAAHHAGLISQVGISVLASGGTPVEGLAVTAHVSGAFTFADGEDTVDWTSSDTPKIVPLDRTTLKSGQLKVTVPETPAAAVHWLEPDTPDVQRLLTAAVLQPREAAAALASLPAFQPTVTTQTSSPTAEPGSQLHDILQVGIADTADNPLGRWLHQPGTGEPLSVEVASTLWGPLDAKPQPGSSVPAGTPKVETVTTRVDGPGQYKTPSLAVGNPGYYVWTETINPASTKPEAAAGFVKPWQGTFGLAAETTLVPWRLTLSTALSRQEAAVGEAVTDHVTVAGLPSERSEEEAITLTMYGPLNQKPRQSAQVPDATPVYARTTVPATNGEHRSSDFGPFAQPGCYTVVAHFAGSEKTLPFTSGYGVPEETVCVSEPIEPAVDVEPAAPKEPIVETSPKPKNPSAATPPPSKQATEPSPPATPVAEAAPRPNLDEQTRLAETGAHSGTIAAIGVLLLGLGLSCGILTWRRRA